MTDLERADLRLRAADRVLPKTVTPAEAVAALPQLDEFVVWVLSGQQPAAASADPAVAS